jgi:hypothetical protein
MARRLTPRSRRWLRWASGLLLIAAGGAHPLAMRRRRRSLRARLASGFIKDTNPWEIQPVVDTDRRRQWD